MVTGAAALTQPRIRLTTNQKRGFLAAWGGWALDGMDSFIYALVLVPALTELLPASGIAVTPANIGYYGSILFALFLFGWGTSMVWGPIGDRIGRVRALMLTILCYSLFTFLCGFVTNIWQLAILRVLCGIGIGGEQPVGATYIAEELDERTRKIGAGLMHTGYYFGFFFAAVANYVIGANYGWRWMFIFGGVPALMIAFIRYGVHESKKWHEKFGAAEHARPKMTEAFGTLFTPRYKHDTMVMSGLFLVSIILLWAGSIYVPTAVTQLAQRAGSSPADAARMASYGSVVLAIGTIIGCVLVPLITERIGRRLTMALFLTILGLSAGLGFGYVFYQPSNVLTTFFVCIFFMGLGGANFAVYTIWLPEQYTTDCRASAIGFISSVGRFVGVAMVFLLGAGIASYGSLGVPVAVVAMAFVFGLVLLPFARETKGQPLPA
ncbi:MAG: MFS transporter [Acidobacteria bacterium]|nr:MFS transporter [Acidobacteriota bacterium]